MSNNNILNNNTISANIGDGVVMEFPSNNNLLWGNNFFNNTGVQAWSNNINQWYDNQTGNDFEEYLTQNPNATNNGIIWKFSYKITGSSNQDLYPLVNLIILAITIITPTVSSSTTTTSSSSTRYISFIKYHFTEFKSFNNKRI